MGLKLYVYIVSSFTPGTSGRVAPSAADPLIYEYYWLSSDPFGGSPRQVGSFLYSIESLVGASSPSGLRFDEVLFQSSQDGGAAALRFLRSATAVATHDFNRNILSSFTARNAVSIGVTRAVRQTNAAALSVIQNIFAPVRIILRQFD